MKINYKFFPVITTGLTIIIVSMLMLFDYTKLSPTLHNFSPFVIEKLPSILSIKDVTQTDYFSILFINSIGYDNAIVITYFISILYFLFFLTISNKIQNVLFISTVFLGSSALFLRAPHKEIVQMLMYLPFLIFYISNSTPNNKSVNIIYLILGAVYKTYFWMILLVAFLLNILTRPKAKIIVIVLSIVIFFLIPIEYYQLIQGKRDLGSRFIDKGIGGESSFSNLVMISNHFDVLVNFVYAALRLNLPILFDFNVKSVIHMYLILNIFHIILKGLYNVNTKYLSLILIAHILISTLYEPDLGSYLRHTLSTFPIFLTILWLTEKKQINTYS